MDSKPLRIIEGMARTIRDHLELDVRTRQLLLDSILAAASRLREEMGLDAAAPVIVEEHVAHRIA